MHRYQDAGIYELDLLGDKVKARCSFIYKYEDGEWKIAHHHSSMMPEPLLAAPAASSDAVNAVRGAALGGNREGGPWRRRGGWRSDEARKAAIRGAE